MTGVDSGWSEKILFHFLEMDYLVGHKPSSFTRKKKMGAINVFVSFSQCFFLVLELSMSWHISVVEIEDDVIKRMPVAMTGIGSVRRKGQILILPVGFKY